MAKRNAFQRAMAGLGVGITNASDLMLKTHLQDKLQDRYDKRAADAQMAQLNRQGQLADRAQMMKVLEEVMKGGDPEAASQMITLLTGQNVGPESLPRPSPRRRMETGLGEQIAKATSAEMVPTDEEILGQARGQGLGLPDFATAGMAPPDLVGEQDPYQFMGTAVTEMRDRAGARRRSWQDKKTEKVVSQKPGGAEVTEFVSPYKTGSVETKPDAAAQGAIEGTKKVNEINTAGKTLAEQVGREATSRTQATQDVELSPDAIGKKADLAGKETYARKVAEINANVDNATKIIDYEYKKAMAMMPTAATEVEYKQWGEQIAKARDAAASSLPVIGQLRALWADAQPVLEEYVNRYGTVRAEQAQQWLPRAMQDDRVRKYFDFLNGARPKLARAMGNVGAFTELEQERGGFLVADVLDAMNGGRAATEKFDRIEKLFMAAPAIAQRQRPGSPPMTAVQMQSILDAYQPGNIELPANQQFDLLLGPDGLKKPGGY